MPTSKEKKEERKRRGLKKSRKGQKVKQPGAYQALLPIFPNCDPALSQLNSLARDGEGWCCAGFGKNSTAAPQGLPVEPCCVAQGHGASLYTHRSLGVLAMGIRRQSHPVANASNSSLFWALNNSSSSVFPKERGTKSCLLLPLWVYQCFLTLSL